MIFSLDEINQVLGLINWNNAKKNELRFNNISIDSRSISAGNLFIALNGKNFDGHDFIHEVIDKGIKAIVIKEGRENLVPDKCPFWIVSEPLEALQKIALYKRKKLNIPVVAITGSVGKTTTKEMLGEILKGLGKVNISMANNNNEIGMALTILNSDETHKIIVLEMGMRGLGQIENLSKFSEPNIAVITNIGSSHIGLLGSRENIAIAKCEIANHLNPKGMVIIPEGDHLLEKTLKKKWSGRIIRVKLSNTEINNQRTLDDYILGSYDFETNMIKVENKIFRISLNGKHNALNFLFSYAVSKELGIAFKKLNSFKFRDINGRNKILRTKKLTIFDETYNASPESVKACIEVLIKQKGDHFLVFGSMKELGVMSIELHQETLDYIYSSNIKKCIFLHDFDEDKLLKKFEFLKKKICFIKDRDSISKRLNKWTSRGDFVLIKGSRYWKLEEIIPLID